jgi:hypothetical protein
MSSAHVLQGQRSRVVAATRAPEEIVADDGLEVVAMAVRAKA